MRVITQSLKYTLNNDVCVAVVRLALLGASCNVVMGDGKWEAMKSYCVQEFYPENHAEHPGCRKRKEGHEAVEVSET